MGQPVMMQQRLEQELRQKVNMLLQWEIMQSLLVMLLLRLEKIPKQQNKVQQRLEWEQKYMQGEELQQELMFKLGILQVMETGHQSHQDMEQNLSVEHLQPLGMNPQQEELIPLQEEIVLKQQDRTQWLQDKRQWQVLLILWQWEKIRKQVDLIPQPWE